MQYNSHKKFIKQHFLCLTKEKNHNLPTMIISYFLVILTLSLLKKLWKPFGKYKNPENSSYESPIPYKQTQ